MRVIYNDGFLPALAIDDSPESSSWGWLMAKNPLDGQWVTIANLSAQITGQTDDVIDAQIADLQARLAETQTQLIRANLEILRHKEYLRDHVHRLDVWIAEARERFGK